MEKMQILFPEPQLARLRHAARVLDRPVSELVREAVDAWLEVHTPAPPSAPERPPLYGSGEISASAATMRDLAWAERTERRTDDPAKS